ncbi:MAG: ABC transporter permease [Spirochaetes bacterium]|nr:ABC transporter permease [Spirochaetota bacterium]
MNGSARKLLLVIRFSFLRMLREPAGTIIMVGMPLVMIPILGAVFAKLTAYSSYLKGAPDMMAFAATGMIVMFQLFSGRYCMDGTRESLLSERKWRIYSAPCAPAIHAMGILAASTLVSLLQGFLLVTFTRLALGVRWGSIAVVFLVLLGATLLSQLVNLATLLLARNYGPAITLSWVFAWGSAALGGLIFPLPMDRPFWHFMATYGTPYSLAQTALIASTGGGAQSEVAVCIGVLFALSALFALVVTLLGRRRLA